MMTLLLIVHLYGHYAKISAIDLAENDANLREAFKPDKPLKILYTRMNECANYATTAGKPITEEQISHIAYVLVTETGQSQEDF